MVSLLSIPVIVYLEVLLSDIAYVTIYGVAWWYLRRLSKRLQSRGLRLISHGFLIEFLFQISWNLIYWIVLEGPFLFFALSQNFGLSDADAAALAQAIGLTETVLGGIIFLISVVLVAHGARMIILDERSRTYPSTGEQDHSGTDEAKNRDTPIMKDDKPAGSG